MIEKTILWKKCWFFFFYIPVCCTDTKASCYAVIQRAILPILWIIVTILMVSDYKRANKAHNFPVKNTFNNVAHRRHLTHTIYKWMMTRLSFLGWGNPTGLTWASMATVLIGSLSDQWIEIGVNNHQLHQILKQLDIIIFIQQNYTIYIIFFSI